MDVLLAILTHFSLNILSTFFLPCGFPQFLPRQDSRVELTWRIRQDKLNQIVFRYLEKVLELPRRIVN